jgi:hypothetical protein
LVSSARKSTTKRSAKRSARAKKPKAKKARLYTRYDPTTGQKVRVTNDTFEYRDWPSRKPSKKKLAREAFKTDPFGTTGSIAQQAAKRSIERVGEHAATRILRGARTAAIPGLVAGARALAPLAGVAGLTAAALGLLLLEQRSVRNARLTLGERVNALSREFVALQQQLAKEYGVDSFSQVPAEARNRALEGYKQAIAKATAATKVTTRGRFGTVTYSTIGR